VTTISARHGLFTPPGPAGTLFLPGLPGGGPTVRDRGPLGCTGTITGARRVCLPGGLWCLDFDGSDDYVNFAGVLPTAGITGNQLGVHLWVRPAGTITSERTFIEARDKFVLRGLATNKLNCRLYLDGSWTGQIELADNSLAPGAWNAVGLSYDGAVVCLYLNGQPETPSNSSSRAASTGRPASSGSGWMSTSTTISPGRWHWCVSTAGRSRPLSSATSMTVRKASSGGDEHEVPGQG